MTAIRIRPESDDAANEPQEVTNDQERTAADRISQDRTAYLEARRNGVPCRLIGVRLGWSTRRAERVRKRINREKRLNIRTPPEHVTGCVRFGSATPEALWFPQVRAHADNSEISLDEKSTYDIDMYVEWTLTGVSHARHDCPTRRV